MATQKAKSRRQERVTESPVRRSARLSRRSAQPEDDFSLYHLTSCTVTSRPTLSGYGSRLKKSNILNESGQSVPSSFENRGLDDSDNESSTSSGQSDNLPSFASYKPGNVYTPVKHKPIPKTQGVVSRMYAFVTSILYKGGSFMYLAATGILCLDVILLNRLFNFGRSPMRTLSSLLLLLTFLIVVVLFLVGGGLISGPVEHPGVDVDMNTVLRRVTSHIQNELTTFKTSFMSDIENHVGSYVNLTMKLSEKKTNTSIEEQLLLRDELLRQYREDLTTELESLLTTRLGDLEVHLNTLEDSLRSIVINVTGDQINAAQDDWLTKVKLEIGVNISNSMDIVKDEILQTLNSRDNAISEQMNSLAERTAALRTDLQATQDDLTGTFNNVLVLEKRIKSHDAQIDILQRKQQEVLDNIAQIKSSTLERINGLEEGARKSLNLSEAIAIFNDELDKNLANQTSSLQEWLYVNYMSKEDYQDIGNKLEELQNQYRDSPVAGLSKKDVEEVISMSLERYNADKIGKFDFALENSGGSVLVDKCSATYSQSLSSVSLFGIPLWSVSGSPKRIIQPQIYPGDCWAFNGTSGYATIKLIAKIFITEVSIEHVPKELSPSGNISSAPQKFSVQGLASPEDTDGTTLGTFTYNVNSTSIQQFQVKESTDTFQLVRFNFISNYGNPTYTCVYRVRVHGNYIN